MQEEKIVKFIKKQKVAFICSVDEAGFPNIKAMLKPRKTFGLREFYFSTNTSSMLSANTLMRRAQDGLKNERRSL